MSATVEKSEFLKVSCIFRVYPSGILFLCANRVANSFLKRFIIETDFMERI